jgi:plastocyanin
MKLASLAILAAVLVFFTGIASADTAQVSIKDYKFQPDQATIKKGDTVTWTNVDPVSHDVKFKDAESPDLKKGETYSRTFNEAGTFDYLCDIHSYMKGKVIVQ